MKRREFVAAFLNACAAPYWASAQEPTVKKIGFLDSGEPTAFRGRLIAFKGGLRELGFEEGRNLIVHYRWAAGRYEQLDALATELVNSKVQVLVATGSPNSAQAAARSTSTIPVVFANGGDPVRMGLVSNLARPESNVTGVSYFNSGLVGKRIQLIKEILPRGQLLAFIVNPNNPNAKIDAKDAEAVANQNGMQIVVISAGGSSDFDDAFLEAEKKHVDGIVVNNDAYFITQVGPLVERAARHRLPTLYYLRDFVVAGGLVSYGTNIEAGYRRAGIYVGRILNGSTPADLPVQLPSTFEFAVNLSTARKLDMVFAPSLLARADEVIE